VGLPQIIAPVLAHRLAERQGRVGQHEDGAPERAAISRL
jgi:hypothetical protein